MRAPWLALILTSVCSESIPAVSPSPTPSISSPSDWSYVCYLHSHANFLSQTTLTQKTDFSVLLHSAGGELAAPKPASKGHADVSSDRAELASARLRRYDGKCFFMRAGWWTYEVCPWHSVKQYHAENSMDGLSKVRTEFSLGKYQQGEDEFQPNKRVYTQFFTEGTDGRIAVVRYICPESKKEEDGVAVVSEMKEKEYMITMRASAVCPVASPSSTASASTARSSSPPTQPASATTAPKVAELLMPQMRLLYSIRMRCFTLTKDYWTYEFCPQKHVRQFHIQGDRGVSTEFSLGKYDKLSDKFAFEASGGSSTGSVSLHVYTQTFANGSSKRRAEVRSVCAAKNEHALLGVEEPQTHQYVLIFSTPLVCELSCAYGKPARAPLMLVQRDATQPQAAAGRASTAAAGSSESELPGAPPPAQPSAAQPSAAQPSQPSQPSQPTDPAPPAVEKSLLDSVTREQGKEDYEQQLLLLLRKKQKLQQSQQQQSQQQQEQQEPQQPQQQEPQQQHEEQEQVRRKYQEVAGVAEDKNVECSMWSGGGECKTNPRFMLRHCQRSCALQVSPEMCQHWASEGVCSMADGADTFMRALCSDACGDLL